MRVAITGGAGFIGGHLAEHLAGLPGCQVVVLDNLDRGSLQNFGPVCNEIEFVRGDVRDARLLNQVFQGCEVVYHLAAVSRVSDCEERPDDCLSVNVCGTYNVLTAAAAHGVRRVVFTSSREVYGEPKLLPVYERSPVAPKNHYGASKAAGEMFCSNFSRKGLEVTTLRLSNVFGPRDWNRVIPKFIELALADCALPVYGGNQVIDFIWIDRTVEALVRAGFGDYIEGPVNVGSGVGTRLIEVAHRIITATNSESRLHITKQPESEVTRYIADATLAHKLFSWPRSEDPLAKLPELCKLIAANVTGDPRYATAEGRV